jgi:putative peptidoglycan lipid II flippase
LNAHRHFAVPALSPILLNVCFLLGALVALRFEGRTDRLVAFSIGGLAGGLAAWLVQLPKLRSLGIRVMPAWAPRDPDVVRVAALMLPGIVALGATQLNLFVDTLLALRLDEGSLTALRLGNRVTLLPLGVVAVAVSTTSLPTLALKAAADDRAALMETLGHTLRLLLTLLLPAAVALAMLAGPIVTLLFQYGEFSAERSVPMTAGVLRVYALALPAFGLVKGLSPGYYAVQDTRTPVKLAAIAVVVNILLDFAFVVPWGLNGLAFATVLASWLNVALLARGLSRGIGSLPRGAMAGAMGRITLATVAMAAAVAGALALGAGAIAGASIVVRVVRVGLAVAAGLAALLAVYRITGHREMLEVLQSLRPGKRP